MSIPLLHVFLIRRTGTCVSVIHRLNSYFVGQGEGHKGEKGDLRDGHLRT